MRTIYVRGMKVLLACLLFITTTAFGRLGETVEEVAIRYGAPITTTQEPESKMFYSTYKANGFKITVGFMDRKSQYEQFQQAKLSSEWSDQEKNAILAANSFNREWKRIEEISLDTKWTLDNAAFAIFKMGIPSTMTVVTTQAIAFFNKGEEDRLKGL